MTEDHGRAVCKLREGSPCPAHASHVESLPGRRGWHGVFHFDSRVSGEPGTFETPASRHAPGALPKNARGAWDVDEVRTVLERFGP